MVIERRTSLNKNYPTPITFYEDVRKAYEEYSRIKHEIQKRLEKYPEGKIRISNKNGNIQYYLREEGNEKTGTYISKKDVHKIRLYLRKKYDEETLPLIESELKALKDLAKISDSKILSIRNKYSDHPAEIKKNIIPADVSDADYIYEWLSVPYKGKAISEDVPMFITNNGEHVRSKSELTIANALARYGVPYKYECPLTLSNRTSAKVQTIYPDFTVLNVKKRREIYWEHRGMMDDPDYSKNSVLRLKQMAREGIYLGDRLIITEETSASSLGTDEIDRVIKHYLL